MFGWLFDSVARDVEEFTYSGNYGKWCDSNADQIRALVKAGMPVNQAVDKVTRGY